MKTLCRTLILVILALSLVLALLSCTNKKENEKENDDWMTEDITINQNNRAGRTQRFDDDDGDSAYQSGERINLPTIPW